MKHLLDSNLLIYAARPQPSYNVLRTWVERADSCVSAITLVEVLGFVKMQPEDALFFSIAFDFLPQLDITATIISRAIAIRRQIRLKTPDAIIAATALEHGLELVAADSDFARVVGLVVLNPFAVS
ncbi:MAG: type II toxin-antitoxin system VapC family toxin [Bacteroidota bacterium]|nr:type II toxin-antitoxin system VapC family toxin [Bacteroidota bacterium]